MTTAAKTKAAGPSESGAAPEVKESALARRTRVALAADERRRKEAPQIAMNPAGTPDELEGLVTTYRGIDPRLSEIAGKRKDPKGKECTVWKYHGYFGLETEVEKDAADGKIPVIDPATNEQVRKNELLLYAVSNKVTEAQEKADAIRSRRKLGKHQAEAKASTKTVPDKMLQADGS